MKLSPIRREPMVAAVLIIIMTALLSISGFLPGTHKFTPTGPLLEQVRAAFVLSVVVLFWSQALAQPKNIVPAMFGRAVLTTMFVVSAWSAYVILMHAWYPFDYVLGVGTIGIALVSIWYAAHASNLPWPERRRLQEEVSA